MNNYAEKGYRAHICSCSNDYHEIRQQPLMYERETSILSSFLQPEVFSITITILSYFFLFQQLIIIYQHCHSCTSKQTNKNQWLLYSWKQETWKCEMLFLWHSVEICPYCSWNYLWRGSYWYFVQSCSDRSIDWWIDWLILLTHWKMTTN